MIIDDSEVPFDAYGDEYGYIHEAYIDEPEVKPKFRTVTNEEFMGDKGEVKEETQAAWISADDMCKAATAPVYLINNIIEAKTHGLIAGSSQSFKSFVALKMAHCICTGNDFFGHDVFNTGKVLYICGEGHGALGRRIKALSIVEGGFNDNFFILERPLYIDNIAEMDWLKKSIDDIKPVFVMFDTFSSLATTCKENVNEEVARVLRMVSDCCMDAGCSSLIVHHYGKDTEKGMRGASAFGANIDYEISMTRPDISTLNATMTCKKSKDGDYFEAIEILAHVVDLGLIRQDGNPTNSLVLKRGDANGNLTLRQERVLNVIREVILKNGTSAVTEKQIRDGINLEFSADVKNPWKIFSDVVPVLVKMELIFTQNGIYWL
jgi:hypothetical protein